MNLEQAKGLIDAHYVRNDDRFYRIALQIASHIKLDRTREEFQKFLAQRHMRNQVFKQLPVLPADLQSIVSELPPVELSDLVLSPEIVTELRMLALEFQYAPALAARNLKPRSRLLFHGPPGCGKSSAARALGALVGLTTYCVSAPRILDSFLGASVKRLDQILQLLNEQTLLVFDEIDSIGSERTSSESTTKEYNTVVSGLLTRLDSEPKGLIVCTTNRCDIMDRALLRRFDTVLEFPHPTEGQANRLIDLLKKKYGLNGQCRFSPTPGQSFDAISRQITASARAVVLAEENERQLSAVDDAVSAETGVEQ